MEILERIYRNIRGHISSMPATMPKAVDFVSKSVNKVKIPPFTRDNVLYYYLPLQGLASYTTLSVSVMNPHLMVR